MRQLLILIIGLLTVSLSARDFEKFTSVEGLSTNLISDIIQDEEGFVWVASEYGIYRFDGYRFKAFRANDNDSSSLIHDHVFGFVKDTSGNIIAVTEWGTSVYNGYTHTFINKKFESRAVNIWVGNHTFLVKHANEKLLHYSATDLSSSNEINHEIINNSMIDVYDGGVVFVDTNYAIVEYSTNNSIYKVVEPGVNRVDKIHSTSDGRIVYWLSNGSIYARALSDSQSHVVDIPEFDGRSFFVQENSLIVKNNSGKILIQKSGSTFDQISDVNADDLREVYLDRESNLWLAHRTGGVSLLVRQMHEFDYWPILNAQNSLECVSSITQLSDSSIIAGTSEGNIYKYNNEGSIVNQWTLYGKHPILSLFVDSYSRIWVSSKKNGIAVYKLNNGVLSKDTSMSARLSFLKGYSVKIMYEDSDGNLMLGTEENGLIRILDNYNTNTQIRENVSEGVESISSNKVTSIVEGLDKSLWVGTDSGLCVIKTDNSIINYHYQKSKHQTASINDITSLCYDRQNRLWVGTHSGLYLLDKTEPIVRKLEDVYGLKNIIVKSIVEDSSGNIWVSSGKGLAMLPNDKDLFLYYGVNHGILPLHFKDNSVCKLLNGDLLFGGINGMCYFSPNMKATGEYETSPVITDFKVFYNSIYNAPESRRKHLKDDEVDVSLAYTDNVFSIEFSSLHYGDIANHRYAYMLEGFEKDWIYSTSFDREVTYTNLSGGEYIFKVKVSDKYGQWSDTFESFKIHIDPPFWDTWWFYLFVFVLVMLTLYFMYTARMTRVLRMRKVLEKQVEQRTHELGEKKQELEVQKEKFMEQRDIANIQKAQIARQKEELEKQRELLEAVVDKRTSDLAIAKEKAQHSEYEKNKSESKYKLIAENARDMILRLKLPEESLDYLSKAAVELTGYSVDDFYNDPNLLKNIVDPKFKDKYVEIYRKAISGSVTPTQEYKIVCKNGESKWVCQRSVLVYGDDDVVEALEAIVFDISERKKAEAKYKAAKRRAEEADKLKSSFLANMSHEIRTPMNSIVGFADLLSDPNISLDEKQAFVEHINTSSASLLHLVDDIIDISKIEAGQLEISKSQCYVNTILEELYSSFDKIRKESAKEDVRIKVMMPVKEENFSIYTDNFRFRQVMMNLIGNALKFTTKGEIEFGYQLDLGDSDKEKTGNVTFFVKDTGKGISDEMLDSVFDRFKTYRDNNESELPGSGLGLAISRNLVELMGGVMWVESKENVGTTFWFSLPLIKPKGLKKKEYSDGKTKGVDWSSKTILLAEDEENNYKFVQAALKKTKVNLLRAHNGQEAIDMFSNNKSNIDIILMDIQMPGMNGYEATQKIKNITEDIPIIAQTAFAMAGGKIKCFEAGCDGYISKPYKAKDLIETISKYL